MKTITLCGVLFVLVIAGTTGCKHDAYETKIANNDTNTTNTQVDTPSFRRDIFPIFKTSCAYTGCHAANSKRAGYEYSDYHTTVAKGIKAGDAANSKVYQSITTREVTDVMPPGAPLLPEQQKLIELWINQGAKNN